MYEIGTKVRLKNHLDRVGIIREIDSRSPVITYAIEFMDRYEYHIAANITLFSGQFSLKDNLVNGRFGQFYDFQKAMTFLKLSNSDSVQNNIYAFNTSKTIFYEYQFKPLLKLISSHKRRLLICDEVGLGKTIEAGLIMKELQARREVSNALIVVPANLVTKWMSEMRSRFQEEFTVIDKQFFLKLTSGDKQAANQYSSNKFIISIESIRGKGVVDVIDNSEYVWDFLIVDEAHSLRNLSKQNRTIQALSNNVQAMILLTATPIHTSSENLFNILHILDESQFTYFQAFEIQREANQPIVHALNSISSVPPNIIEAYEQLLSVEKEYSGNLIYTETLSILQRLLSIDNILDISIEDIVLVQRNLSDLHLIGGIYNRTKKRDVHANRPVRIPKTVHVELLPDELDLYNFLIAKTRLHLQQESSSMLPLSIIQRMLSSSIHAHKSAIIQKYSIDAIEVDGLEDLLYQETEELVWNVEPSVIDNDTDVDSKFFRLIDELEIIKERTNKVIIFAFFKETLQYLCKRLEAISYNTIVLTGALSMSQRSDCLQSFREADVFSILLSSRVGSEGIDLQFCNTIVNYDLPWNPMEIEQRIGRIDRIGQTSPRLDIINFCMDQTIDDRIIIRLYERVNLFEGTIGSLEPILGDLIDDLNKTILYKNLTLEEADQQWYEQEKIIMHRIKSIEELESASSDLISLDYYYEYEIKNIIKKKRYISPDHLYQYISGYLVQNYRDSYIKYDSRKKEGEIQLCDRFRRVAMDSKFDNLFQYSFNPGRKVQFTFHSDHASENPDLAFINVLHPLVQFITSQYSLDKSNILNCHYFLIHQADLKENEIDLDKGYYFYFVYLASVSSFKKHSVIMSVILDVSLNVVGSSDFSEHVMGVLNELGRHSTHELQANSQEIMTKAYNVAFDHFKVLFFEYYQSFKARHDMIIERKVQSRKFHYMRQIDRRNKEIAEINQSFVISNEDRFRRNMLESQIKVKMQALNQSLEQIRDEKECIPVFEDPVFGGVFEVV